MTSVTAYAPSTMGNVGVGFDILGLAFDATGDLVTVTKSDRPGIRITNIDIEGLPTEPSENTATVPMLRMMADFDFKGGLDVEIKKGISIGSGMGGSAASAVAGTLAACQCIAGRLLPDSELLSYALDGEQIATGSRHADNVAPALLGGIVLCDEELTQLPVPSVTLVIVKPNIVIETRAARLAIPETLAVSSVVEQTLALAQFVDACHRNDTMKIVRTCRDHMIEPFRKAFIPGFDAAASAAAEHGCGIAISGAGPAVFSLAPNRATAVKVATGIEDAFKEAGVESWGWTGPISSTGARIL